MVRSGKKRFFSGCFQSDEMPFDIQSNTLGNQYGFRKDYQRGSGGLTMVEMAENSKNRTKRINRLIWISVVTVILTLTVIFTMYHIHSRINDEKQKMAYAYRNVSLVYAESVRDTIDLYTAEAKRSMDTPRVLEAFRSGDRDGLYRLILPRWKSLREENPSLYVMQFHKADGTSLLRVHNVTQYGDIIAAKRPMVRHVHQTHEVTSGFEEGSAGLAFRILLPLIDNGTYLGAVEFGLSTRSIIDKIERYTRCRSFLLLKREVTGHFAQDRHYLRFGEYVAIDIPRELLEVVKRYAHSGAALQDTVIALEERSYMMKHVTVADFAGRETGMIVFTREIPDFRAEIGKSILVSVLIAIALILFFGFLISRIFSRINAKVQFNELYHQTILDTIPSPVFVSDGKETIAANRTFLDYLGYETLDDYKRDHACVCDYFEEGDTEDYLKSDYGNQRWTEYVLARPDVLHKAKITIAGKTTVFDVRLSRMSMDEKLRYVVIFSNISSIQALTATDQLTGVANRLHFTMAFEHDINVARRERSPLSVIFFDIDHFKRVNDEYGHLIGDSVLVRLASLVGKRIRRSDVLARWGGEEFIVLLPNTPLAEATEVAEMLRSRIETEPFETVGTLTCSFGVAVLEENDTSESLLKRVDTLLYEAKWSGRNCVVSMSLSG